MNNSRCFHVSELVSHPDLENSASTPSPSKMADATSLELGRTPDSRYHSWSSPPADTNPPGSMVAGSGMGDAGSGFAAMWPCVGVSVWANPRPDGDLGNANVPGDPGDPGVLGVFGVLGVP